ncbi:hypothetical protein [Candidatus Amarolinea dominans]|uniref:hypothetical protein n=1 Tax=Candidatus Amarolinea dominans TaxID=3140696 RepID=UPI0031370265|nr:hypothetical protein [Anaerolineae bacterium]
MALIMFDVAVAWLFVFLRYSEGIAQRAIAVVVSFISLVGGHLPQRRDLYLGGQTLTSVPQRSAPGAVGHRRHDVGAWGGDLGLSSGQPGRKCALSRRNRCSTTAKRWRWIGQKPSSRGRGFDRRFHVNRVRQEHRNRQRYANISIPLSLSPPEAPKR